MRLTLLEKGVSSKPYNDRNCGVDIAGSDDDRIGKQG